MTIKKFDKEDNFVSFIKVTINELIDFIKKEDKVDNCFNVTLKDFDEEVYFEYQNKYGKTIREAIERYGDDFEYDKYNVKKNKKALLEFFKENYLGYLYTTYGDDFPIFKQDLKKYKGKEEEKLANFILKNI